MPPPFDAGYYAANYPNYERQNPPRKLAHYRAAIARHLPRGATPPRVLDLGCAFGRFLASCAADWQRYGTDISEHAIACAARDLPDATLGVLRDGAIPFDQRFDVITAWDVLEHVPDLDRAAADITAHLQPDGILVFVVPVYDGPLGPLVNALDHDETHLHRRGRRFWLEWTARYFTRLEWYGIFRHLLPGGYYAHWPTRALRSIAPAILIAARRGGRDDPRGGSS